MGVAGAGVGGRGAVPLQHLAGAPAGDAQKIGLVAALAQSLVGEGVAEPMGMQAGDAGLIAAALQQLTDARGVSEVGQGSPAAPGDPRSSGASVVPAFGRGGHAHGQRRQEQEGIGQIEAGSGPGVVVRLAAASLNVVVEPQRSLQV